MGEVRSLIGIIGMAGLFFLAPVSLAVMIFCNVKKQKRPKAAKISVGVFIGMVLLTAGCYLSFFLISVKLYRSLDLEKLPTFTVTSEELQDGVWDAVISNTSQGENRSPSLSWEPVDGATCYAVCMVDASASDWLHWKQNGITSAGLAAGAASASEYIGPYPPSGTHQYTVYVFALKQQSDFRGSLDSNSMDLYTIAQAVDMTEHDQTGNVIAYGKLSGSFSHVEE